jgi:hypothetical protein
MVHALLNEKELSLAIRSFPDPDRIRHLNAALEAEKLQIEEERQILRLKLAEVERELNELTSQQAEHQKLQVAIDRLLKYLSQHEFPTHEDLESARLRGLAGAKVTGTC